LPPPSISAATERLVRDVDAIIEEVRPALEALEKKRQELVARRWKAGKNIFIAAVVIFGVGCLVAFVAGGHPSMFVVAGVVALIVSVILLIVKIVVPTSRFKKEFKLLAIGAIVKAMEPEMTFSPEHGVPQSQFVRSELFQRPDRYNCEDGLHGKIGDTTVHISEVHAEQKHTRTDSKGNTQTRYTTIFDGLFMVADFHKHFSGTTRVLPDTAERIFGGLGRLLQDFRPFSKQDLVYLEDPEFEGEFVVYGTDQIEARYILSTAMLRRILDLKRRWRDEVRLSFIESNVFVAISHKSNLFEPDIGGSVLSRELIGRIVAELAVCFGLVDDLNLNTRIWTKT
jgi:hypothetical protein